MTLVNDSRYTYVIGDVQGCYDELQQLLEKISFDPQCDRLGFVGDLVNRGPRSLEVLRFIRALPKALVVLGNHDLYLLALGVAGKGKVNDTIRPILEASDRDELLQWLRQQPLFHWEPAGNWAMVHAGVPPQWTLADVRNYAQEVEAVLRGPEHLHLLTHLLGDEPTHWDPLAQGLPRWRYILNALTRMRCVTPTGVLNFHDKAVDCNLASGFVPWFQCLHPEWRRQGIKILFGHWAALGGQCPVEHCLALDTGCVWGKALTAYRVEDGRKWNVDA